MLLGMALLAPLGMALLAPLGMARLMLPWLPNLLPPVPLPGPRPPPLPLPGPLPLPAAEAAEVVNTNATTRLAATIEKTRFMISFL